MEPVRVGMLGLGTVGAGVINLLARNGAEIARRGGRAIEVVHVCARDLSKPRGCSLDGLTVSARPEAVIDDPQVEILIELIGGLEPARELVLRAIAHRKHVVTANKALIALHGNEIFAAAREQGVVVAFEAAVAGGIPIIKAIREGLAGNRIEWLAGIINGTSNYILTEMRERGATFAAALADAQRLGYAEADPSFDVDGIDAAHKLTILGAIAFGKPLRFSGVYTEGIAVIEPDDVRYAEQLGYRIKHLGVARRRDQGVELRVHPTLIPERSLIASVQGAMNAVLVHGDAVGPTLYYGAGAGAKPTASAVVADLVDVVRAHTTDPHNRVPHLAFQPDALSQVPVLPISEAHTAYYLRMLAEDRPGVLAEVATVLGDSGISLQAVVQPEPPHGAARAHLVFLSYPVREAQMDAALARIRELDTVSGPVTRIRVEHLDVD